MHRRFFEQFEDALAEVHQSCRIKIVSMASREGTVTKSPRGPPPELRRCAAEGAGKRRGDIGRQNLLGRFFRGWFFTG